MPRRNSPTAQNAGLRRSSATSLSLTDSFDDLLGPVRTNLERYRSDAVSFAKKNPEKALLTAVAVGYLLRLLPINRILGGLILTVLSLWKPAALIFGGRKLWEKLQENTARAQP